MLLAASEIDHALSTLESKLQTVSKVYHSKLPMGSTIDQDDLLQEARIAVLKAIDEFDSRKAATGHFHSFAMMRVRHRLTDTLRGAYNWAKLFVMPDEHSFWERLIDFSRSSFSVEELDLIAPLSADAVELLNLVFGQPSAFVEFATNRRIRSGNELLGAARNFMGITRREHTSLLKEIQTKVRERTFT